MDLTQTLSGRRSCRAYLSTPVPREKLEQVLALASRSASNSNSQPWQVHVVTGPALRRLTEDLLKAYDAGDGGADYDHQPPAGSWPEPFLGRRHELGHRLYSEAMGIARDDMAGRMAHHRRNYEFFGAPVGMVLTVSRSRRQGALVDAGLFLQALMLAARAAGLDTCAQAALSDFAPVLRRNLDIPDDELVVCGLSLGYGDPDHSSTRCRTSRVPVARFTTFHEDGGAYSRE
ncbi:nitroreductase [Kutzneria sp. CA-103260]|uniref:nitroreductase n=1 Tax=Kutzneria sp. CA-103260 TaxID=2802641 RepID=UPI001BA883C7|nr:nitroreductase [Kutzneria sp. CA-103260]QUQ66298.1 oxidoreductase [Kutzneria sp. CA-103260]